MKGLMLKAGLLGLFFAIVTSFAAAQGTAYATIHGKCKDAQGAPVVDAEIVWKNQNDGRTYRLKTNKKGEFFSLGVEAGQYTITLSKDGKVLDEQKNVHVGIEEFNYDVDLKQAQEQSIKEAAKKTGVSTGAGETAASGSGKSPAVQRQHQSRKREAECRDSAHEGAASRLYAGNCIV